MSDIGIPIKVTHPEKAIAYLRKPQTIRDHCMQIRKSLESGESEYFYYHPEKWSEICELVSKITLENYPDLNVPLHSRWRHFNAGKIHRLSQLADELRNVSNLEKARVQCELVILSVFLDAGAGDSWSYFEKSSKEKFTRSEGLAVASYHMYCGGHFSSDISQPFRADSTKLKSLTVKDLQNAFQVSDQNPLQGVEGRSSLLNRLGQAIENAPQFFPEKRLGNFFNILYKKAMENKSVLFAEDILNYVLQAFQEIWPSRLMIESSKLGDVARHSKVKGDFDCNELVPFHKLSQWLSYSLVEPLQEAGVHVENLDELTGLAEYRNGGLFLDGGLLSLKKQSLAEHPHAPDSEFITEWRALTISMLDELAGLVRKQLKKNDLTLGQILQGGTWAAGRELAYKFRKDGAPPLRIQSDGTVF